MPPPQSLDPSNPQMAEPAFTKVSLLIEKCRSYDVTVGSLSISSLSLSSLISAAQLVSAVVE